MNPHNIAFVDQAYQEKPRPDLYNIVKKLRDMKTSYSRLLYVAEVKEKDLSAYFLEYQQNYEITGLLLMMGKYYIHYVECEHDHFKNMVFDLKKDLVKNNIHKEVWIIHYTEEKAERLFEEWLCKSIAMSGSGKEQNAQPPNFLQRSITIYEGICKISDKIKKEKEKGKSEFGMTIKQHASDLIPSGEELASIVTDADMTLREFTDFFFTPPDIVLEEERCWPQEPDLTY